MRAKMRMTAAVIAVVMLVALSAAGSTVNGVADARSELSDHFVVLPCQADAALLSESPNTKFGDQDWLGLAHDPLDGESAASVLRFDLSSLPGDAVVDTAELRLFLYQAGAAGSVSIPAYYVTSPWDESNVTWNTPLSTGPSGVLASIDDVVGSYKSWTITSFAQAWTDDPGTNYGVLLRGPDSGVGYGRWFESSETLDLVPLLEVSYQLPAYTFSGHVYEGDVWDTSTPAEGVTVQLWGDEDECPEAGFERVLLISDRPYDENAGIEAKRSRILWLPRWNVRQGNRTSLFREQAVSPTA